MLAKHITSQLTVAGHQVQLSYEGQSATCLWRHRPPVSDMTQETEQRIDAQKKTTNNKKKKSCTYRKTTATTV
jgi:hypothetical protein